MVFWRPFLLAVPLLVLSAGTVAHADQYRSEARVAPTTSQTQQHRSARQMLQTTKNPYDRALLLRSLAATAAQNKHYKVAARYLQQALAEHSLSKPAQDEMRSQLVALRTASGDPKAVIEALEPAYQRNHKLPADQLAALGAAYARLKHYHKAMPPLQQAIRAVRSAPASWYQALAASQIGAGADRQAVGTLQYLLRLKPNDGADWMRLAALQVKTNDQSGALVTLELALRLGYVQDTRHRLLLVTLMARSGNPFGAGSLMQRWIDKGVVKPTAKHWKMLGTLWQRARERELALTAYRRALKLAPETVLYERIGQLDMALQRYDQAARALRTAVKRGAHSGSTLLSLGLASYQQANLKQAVKAFRRAAQERSSRKQARQWLAFLKNAPADLSKVAAQPTTAPPQLAPAVLARTFQGAPVQIASGNATQQINLQSARSAGSQSQYTVNSHSRLTPVGATRAGSADGTVPPWRGGITPGHWPASFHRGHHLTNPFPHDKPLFTVTAANAARYAKYLIPGYRKLLKKYPDFKMKVYPSRRTVSYPKAIYQATQANIGKAKLIGPDALVHARLGFPFPHPANGVQVMWNHRLRYRGDSLKMHSTQAVVYPDGRRSFLHQTEIMYARYANIRHPVNIDKDNILLDYLTWFGRDVGSVDFLSLIHETANSLKKPRAVWVMPPNMTKLFRIPPVGYDQPFPGSGGIYFLDMFDMYNGPFNRYVWKLKGKRELLVPYNDYRLSDGQYSYDQLLTPRHFNQNAVRYEMHRLWVVEATLRPGQTHAFGKRVFYVDEDSWNVVLVENYDHHGRLWRFQEGHLLPLYNIQAADCIPVVTYDFKTGRYFANRLIGHDKPVQYNIPGISAADFSPGRVHARYAH